MNLDSELAKILEGLDAVRYAADREEFESALSEVEASVDDLRTALSNERLAADPSVAEVDR